jgi:exosortase/archaeosortase family protein
MTFFLAFLLNLPEFFSHWLRYAVSKGITSLAAGIGLSSEIYPNYIISIDGFKVSIILECTAISYIMLFLAAIFAYPATYAKKLYGALIGISFITFFNLVRVTFIAWVGAHHYDHFELVHKFLWEFTFLLLVIITWIVWLNTPSLNIKKIMSLNNFKKRIIALILLFLVFWFANDWLAQLYAIIQANISSLPIYILDSSNIIVSSKAGNIVFIKPALQTSTTLKVLSISDLFLFSVLTISFSNIQPLRKHIRTFILGLALIFTIHFSAILITYAAMRLHGVLWSIVNLMSIAVPFSAVIIWLALNRRTIFKDKKDFRAVDE